MDQQAFVNGYLSMMEEAFEGPQRPWSAFLDRGTGLFETLEALPAETASAAPKRDMNTIAGHAEHLRFALAGTRAFLHGETKPPDWRQSWHMQKVDARQWHELRVELKREYQALRGFAENQPSWDEASVAGAIGLLAHVAYHLGALRQIERMLAVHDRATSA